MKVHPAPSLGFARSKPQGNDPCVSNAGTPAERVHDQTQELGNPAYGRREADGLAEYPQSCRGALHPGAAGAHKVARRIVPDLEQRSGLSADTLARLCVVLAATPTVTRASFCGSRARGRHRPGSDIDHAVEGTLGHTQTIQLLERLEGLDLPDKIDLALLHEVTDPALHAASRREGLLLYEAETTSNPLHATQTR